MALWGNKTWSVGEVLTALNMTVYTGPPPDLVDIDVFGTAISQTNWNTLSVDTSSIYNGRKDSTGAQNAEINWDVLLGAGTWTIELIYLSSNTQGIFTVQLSTDGTVFTNVGSAPYNASGSTIDSYSASPTKNVVSSLTGITVSTTGRYRLKLLMATKNGSSSGYGGSLQHVQLRRTA
jgi:hypothetical protein